MRWLRGTLDSHGHRPDGEELAEQIEVNLELLGVTGIEDKLQVGVPEPW